MNNLQNTHIVTVNCGSEYGRMKFWLEGAANQAQALKDEKNEIVYCVLALNEGKAYFYSGLGFADYADFSAAATSIFNADRSDDLTVVQSDNNVLVLE